MGKAQRLETPPDTIDQVSDNMQPAQSILVVSKIGRQHKSAALRIQRVFRGHVGRAFARQVIVDLYATYDDPEYAADDYHADNAWIEGQQPVADESAHLGHVWRDEGGAMSPCSDSCMQARHALNRGDLPGAWEHYSRASEHTSADTDLDAEIQEALDALEVALQCNVQGVQERCEALCAQAKAQLSAAHVDSACRTFTAVLLLDPNHFEALCGRAAVWVRTREYTRAVEDAGAAAAINHQDARVHSLDGAARLGLGDMTGARKCFRHGLRIDARNKFMLSGLDAIGRIIAQQLEPAQEVAHDATQRQQQDNASSQHEHQEAQAGLSPADLAAEGSAGRGASRRVSPAPDEHTLRAAPSRESSERPPLASGIRTSRPPSALKGDQYAPSQVAAALWMIPTRVPSDIVSRPTSRASRASSDAQYQELLVACDAQSGTLSNKEGDAVQNRASSDTGQIVAVVPKRTPSPLLFKNLEKQKKEELQLFLSTTLPLEAGLPLLQGVVRRMAVARVASYWRTYRDDVRGRLPHALKNLPAAPGGVKLASKLDYTSSGQHRPGEKNVAGMLGVVSRLQAAVRAKLALMLFASGRLWFAETVTALTSHHNKHTALGGGVGPLHDMLVQLLLEDGGMVRKERSVPSTLSIDELGLFDQHSIGNFEAFGARRQHSYDNLPHSMVGLLYWSTSWADGDGPTRALATHTRQSSADGSALPLLSPASTATGGYLSPVEPSSSNATLNESGEWGFLRKGFLQACVCSVCVLHCAFRPGWYIMCTGVCVHLSLPHPLSLSLSPSPAFGFLKACLLCMCVVLRMRVCVALRTQTRCIIYMHVCVCVSPPLTRVRCPARMYVCVCVCHAAHADSVYYIYKSACVGVSAPLTRVRRPAGMYVCVCASRSAYSHGILYISILVCVPPHLTHVRRPADRR